MIEPADMKLILVAPDEPLCAAWRTAFAGMLRVSVVHGLFEHLPEGDCMVSPANSSSFMDGGVDAAITRFFGAGLQARVLEMIARDYLGEQPVGTSVITPTDDNRHPYIAHTPTMRVPMPIMTTDYAYVAMWAMLLAVRRHNRDAQTNGMPPIETVACPGLGTGTGRMPAPEAARQMALAYWNFIAPPPVFDWQAAHDRQAILARGGDLRSRRPMDET